MPRALQLPREQGLAGRHIPLGASRPYFKLRMKASSCKSGGRNFDAESLFRGRCDLDGHSKPSVVALDIEQLQLDAARGCAVHAPVLYVDPAARPWRNLCHKRVTLQIFALLKNSSPKEQPFITPIKLLFESLISSESTAYV